MGDPFGIGPEVIVKSLANEDLRGRARFFIFGPHSALYRAAHGLDIEPFWNRIQPSPNNPLLRSLARTADSLTPQVTVVDISDHRLKAWEDSGSLHGMPGPSSEGGAASLAAINEVIGWAYGPGRPGRDPALDAIVTAPISKASWSLAGMKRFPGHTELLADRTGARRYAMLFVAPGLRVVLATIHLPLMDIRNVLTIGKVFDPIDLGSQSLTGDFGIASPRIAVCGLNPHASEGGLFGDEEARLIEPAIRLARDQGIDASGPWPADTVFNAAREGRFDLVVAMYHDQGTIPIKLLARDEGVNMTLGLPIIRTSPDHGTAFDIAGKNCANPGSMTAAIRLAIDIVTHRKKSQPRSTAADLK